MKPSSQYGKNPLPFNANLLRLITMNVDMDNVINDLPIPGAGVVDYEEADRLMAATKSYSNFLSSSFLRRISIIPSKLPG